MKRSSFSGTMLIIVLAVVVCLGAILTKRQPSTQEPPVGGVGADPVTRNAGCTLGYNASWIPHGLGGDPGTTGSITLSLRGANRYNATMILRVPTVIQSNATHFQIEFYMWETITWTLVPVTTVEAQWIYWDAYYKVGS